MNNTTHALTALDSWEFFVGGPPRDTLSDSLVYMGLLTMTGHPLTRHGALMSQGVGQAFHAEAAWARDGFPTFRLTHGLTAGLLLTDSDDSPADEARLPFPSMRIEFPGGEDGYPIKVRDGRGTVLGVRSVLIHTTESPASGDDLRAALTASRKAGVDALVNAGGEVVNRIQNEDGSMLLAVEADVSERAALTRAAAAAMAAAADEALAGKPMERTLVLAMELDSGVVIIESTSFKPVHATVGALLDDLAGRHQDPVTAEPKDGRQDLSDILKSSLDSLLALNRIVINLALYLNREGAGEGTAAYGKPVRSAPVKTDERPVPVSPKVWVVGQDVKLPREVRLAASAALVGGHGRTPWTVEARHLVRGHMKRQFYGPGREGRRRIWVAPYWRGPEDSVVVTTRAYDVGLTAEET